jgi:hypothetical protein
VSSLANRFLSAPHALTEHAIRAAGLRLPAPKLSLLFELAV